MITHLDIAASGPVRTRSGVAGKRELASERAHRIAERLQGILLRTHPLGALPGITTEGFYEAVFSEAKVGGDSFDAFPLTGGRVALAVADASGKGLDDAERVAEVRFALRAFLREHHEPGQALACLNEFVCDCQRLDGRDDGTFVTLTLAILDSSSGEMVCLCAGGEPPLVLRSRVAKVVPACGPILGLSSGQGYAAATLQLVAGDTVLLTTDGLTEARCHALSSPDGSRVNTFLGLEGLALLATSVQVGPQDGLPTLASIGRAVFEGARDFAGGAFHDDVCLLVARRQSC